MEIFVNGSTTTVPEALTVRGLIEHLGLAGGPVAVEVNQQIVPRAEHVTRLLRSLDKVELVHLVGGG